MPSPIRSCPAPSATTTTAWPAALDPLAEARPGARLRLRARTAPRGSARSSASLIGQRRIAGDEPRMPAHQLDQPHAVRRRLRLDVRRRGSTRCARERGLEAEALVDEHDVVVDRLRDADDRDLRPALGDLLRRSACAPRSVPSPPITNSTLMLIRSRQSTISLGSCSPREVPRIVPPCSLMSR